MIPKYNLFTGAEKSGIELDSNDDGRRFDLFRNAILSAIEQEEHIIYCICEPTADASVKKTQIMNAVSDLSGEGIYMYFVSAECAERLPINADYDVLFGVSRVSSFVITKPLYQSVLYVMNHTDLKNTMSWLDFLKVICPHSFGLSKQNTLEVTNHRFHIISPFWNVSPFIDDYYHSIVSQDYSNYIVYLVDDCSTDQSLSRIPDNGKFRKISNLTKKYALQNIIETLQKFEFEDEDVICLLDGDDRFSSKYTLNILNNLYALDQSTLFTYGGMRIFNGLAKYGSRYSKEEFSDLRNQPWKILHMRTFKYKLFKELLIQDPLLQSLKDSNGNLFKMPYDMALLFPLIELAGFFGVRYTDTILYDYRLHENNDHNVNRELQELGEREIRLKQCFKQAF
ncbi:glycosyltransferase family A protein [Pedobacter panaciterrae]|uniref:glycosyltransferase family A protein n=1 Tax=Pedobacter panaciterrae TaxID=363849 RepID=UPI00259863D4|nr:glycosyltransferase family A protein [uncultured Pedobacter sp.]